MEWKILNLRLITEQAQRQYDWGEYKENITFFWEKSATLISHIPCTISQMYHFVSLVSFK